MCQLKIKLYGRDLTSGRLADRLFSRLQLPSGKKLQLAAHVVFYTYKWLQFAVVDAASAVLVVAIIVTEYTYCANLDNLL